MNSTEKKQDAKTTTTETENDWCVLERFAERLHAELNTPEGRARLTAFLDKLAP